jgi:tripartite-type tricarboxylate transporter receptor subunit TctC
VRKWLGLMAPAGTPPKIIARLNQSVYATLRSPDTRGWMIRPGFEVTGRSPEDFGRTLRLDCPKWRDTMRRLGLGPG